MIAGLSVEAESFEQTLHGVCQLHRVRVAPHIEPFPPPHSLFALQEATTALGLQSTVRQVLKRELSGLQTPFVALVKPATAPGHPSTIDDAYSPYRLRIVVKCNGKSISSFEQGLQHASTITRDEFDREFAGSVMLFGPAAREPRSDDGPRTDIIGSDLISPSSSHVWVTDAPARDGIRANPSVAVVIVAWNSSLHLAKCLKQLHDQTVRPRRVVIVDNASRDRSCDQIFAQFPEVEHIRLDQNIGFAAANNLAVRRADDCEWIALLNPDAFPEPGWLAALMDAAARHPEYQVFASRQLLAFRPGRLDGAGDAYHVSGLAWRRGYDSVQVGTYVNAEEVFSACAAAALYNRNAFEAVGGFDEDFFCYIEDVDLGFRLKSAGYRCLYVPNAVVHHVGSATVNKDGDFAIYHAHRNSVWTYVKNMPGLLFWIYLPQHIAANGYIIARCALKGRRYWRIILKTKWDAIKGLPRMWRKRKEIQARRVVGAWEMRKMMAKGFPRRD